MNKQLEAKPGLFKFFLLIGKVLPIRYVRFFVSKFLMQKSKTKQGFEQACQRLVDPKVSRPEYLEPFPNKWWTVDPIVQVNRLGLNLSLDLRDNLQRCVYFTGKYEPETLEFIRSELKKGDTFLDIGAHIGIHALVAAKKLKELGGGNVIAFEPTQDSSKKLSENASTNKLDIGLNRIALGNTSSKMPLYGDVNWGTHDAGVRSFFGNGLVIQEVKVERFDDWNKKSPIDKIDVVKIDAEGAEFDILKGMSTSIATYQPRCLIFEVKESLLIKAGINLEDILSLMENLGYYVDGKAFEGNQVFRFSN